MIIKDRLNPNEPVLDKVLGSGVFVGIYWESVARNLNLPIISSMFDRAESENGFSIEGETLIKFEIELKKLYLYWSEKSKNSNEIITAEESIEKIQFEEYDRIVAGEKFLNDLEEIQKAVNFACLKKLKLVVG